MSVPLKYVPIVAWTVARNGYAPEARSRVRPRGAFVVAVIAERLVAAWLGNWALDVATIEASVNGGPWERVASMREAVLGYSIARAVSAVFAQAAAEPGQRLRQQLLGSLAPLPKQMTERPS